MILYRNYKCKGRFCGVKT